MKMTKKTIDRVSGSVLVVVLTYVVFGWVQRLVGYLQSKMKKTKILTTRKKMTRMNCPVQLVVLVSWVVDLVGVALFSLVFPFLGLNFNWAFGRHLITDTHPAGIELATFSVLG